MNTIKLNTIGERPIKKGGAGGGGGNKYTYYDISGLSEEDKRSILALSLYSKVNWDGGYEISPATDIFVFNYPVERVLAIATDLSFRLIINRQHETIASMFDKYYPSLISKVAEITENEFYGILLDNEFEVGNSDSGILPTTFKFDKGMTWQDWCNSEYNIYGYYIDKENHMMVNGKIGGSNTSVYLSFFDNSAYSTMVFGRDLVESRRYFFLSLS